MIRWSTVYTCADPVPFGAALVRGVVSLSSGPRGFALHIINAVRYCWIFGGSSHLQLMLVNTYPECVHGLGTPVWFSMG
jgi:hypothetical protein